MFSKSRTNSPKNPKKSAPDDSRSASAVGPSIIGADLTVVGDLKSKGEIQIDGAVEGNVTAKNILVTQGGRVLGELHAPMVAVHGRVKGKIVGGKVHLHPTSAVEGGISNERITIDDGAQFSGQMNQNTGKSEASDNTPKFKSAADIASTPQVVDIPTAKKA